jgi:tetratricopeptide (TPR) repeat protein
MKKQFLLSTIFIIFSNHFLSQNKTIDSLKLVLKNSKHDTTRCNVLNLLIEASFPKEEWKTYNEEIMSIAEKNYNTSFPNKIIEKTFAKYYADALNNAGYMYKSKSEIPKALEYYNKSLNIRLKINDKKGQAESYNNIGVIFDYQGDVNKTLEYYNKSLKLKEEIGDEKEIATTRNNIGLLYGIQGDITKAIEYFNKNLKMQAKINDLAGMALSYNNIGYVSDLQKDFTKALENYKISLKIYQDIGDKNSISRELNNIGVLYFKQNDFPLALRYYLESLEIFEETKNLQQKGNVLHNIGKIYFKQKNYKQALYYGTQALDIGQELGFPYNIMPAASLLNQIHKATGNPIKALEYYELYILMRDSINNTETRKSAIKSLLKYEYEKKTAADSIKVAEEKKVTAAQLKQEKTQRFALYGGLALVLVFAGFMFNRFRITQKQKHIIELKEKETQLQKSIIEEKHKEITDSINYAERIQRSFLATKELLDENLSSPRGGAEGGGGYFVFFKPKDVVSGDFYWSAKLSNGNFALATADSTGHGVPGAIMSLLNVTSLEKAIEHHTNPAEILNHTRQTIIERLKKDGSEEGGKDGMDCSLLVFDFVSPFEGGAQRARDVAAILYIAAANNPVWIIRSVSTSAILSGVEGQVENKYELIEIKPDKMPVGKSERQNESFTLQTIELQKGDTIYTLTDGFPDQFGGDKGKKFMSKKLKELLLANVHLSITQQKELLDATFKNWLGNLEQVDDVTVIGIKI